MRRSRRAALAGARGVTLLEVMAVVTILLVLATLGTSQVVSVIRASREHAEVSDVVGHLKEARSLARSLLTPTSFSVQGRQIQIQPTGRTARAYPLGANIERVTLAEGQTSLAFDELGGTSLLLPTTVEIVTASRKVHSIRIYPAIGAIRWGP